MFKFIEAKQVADIVDPSTTLGIEITDKAIAARCGLGNIDGQHGTGDCSYDGEIVAELLTGDRYAPECASFGAAIAIALAVYIPRTDTTLATTRADVDSIGAMAVLVLRVLGLAINVEFVKTIATADSFRVDEWSPRPLPTEENPWPTGTTTVDATQSLAAFGMICSPRPNDRTRSLTLAQRVFLMAVRLATIDALVAFGKAAPYVKEYRQLSDSSRGELRLAEMLGVHPLFDGRTAVGYIGGLHNEAHKTRQALARAAHEPGAVTIRDLWCQSIDERPMSHRGPFASEADAVVEIESMDLSADRDMYTVGHSKFVEVRVAHAGALSLGYCLAPVVVAFDQSNKGKVTIAAYTDGHLDAVGLTAELSQLEEAAGGSPKWGGPKNMCCSPSHVGTRLAEETISDAVSRFVVRR